MSLKEIKMTFLGLWWTDSILEGHVRLSHTLHQLFVVVGVSVHHSVARKKTQFVRRRRDESLPDSFRSMNCAAFDVVVYDNTSATKQNLALEFTSGRIYKRLVRGLGACWRFCLQLGVRQCGDRHAAHGAGPAHLFD